MSKHSIEYARKQSKKWNKMLEKKVMSRPIARAAYERTKKEIEISLMLRKKREHTKLSQEIVAERMDTTRTVVSRLEATTLDKKHSPSLNTLLRYAQALGYTIKLTLVPNKPRQHR